MNLPNAISLLRIVLVPFFIVLYLQGQSAAAAVILALCGISDVADGAIARKYGLVTDLGKILDPVADKLIQAAMMVCAASVYSGVWLLLILHVLREAVLAGMGLHIMRVTGQVFSAKWFGKLCTALLYAVLGAILLVPGLPDRLASTGVTLCAGMIVFCLAMYLENYVRILREFRQGKRNI